MKHFILFYDYPSDYLERRAPWRPAHLAHARASVARGELHLGGILNDPLDGSALVFKTASRDIVETFARNDPYVVNGVATGWRVREWTTILGADALTKV
ncbi:MAG: YciI-like protein [Amphiplicatus sp.]